MTMVVHVLVHKYEDFKLSPHDTSRISLAIRRANQDGLLKRHRLKKRAYVGGKAVQEMLTALYRQAELEGMSCS